MPSQSFPVRPGPPTPLTGALAEGALISNTDNTASVWVADNPGVAPGNGTRLGPLGSLSWSTPGPAYACVDTGVIAAVGVSVSTDVATIDNPVDIATATASALALKGIPNVLTGALVYSTSTPLINFPAVDVSGYASVSITINMQGPGYVYYYFQDPSGLTTTGYRQFSVAAASTVSITATVTGPIMYMGMSSGIPCTAAVYASNRVLPATFAFGGVATSVSGWADNATFAWVSGTTQAIGNRLLSTNGGLHYARFNLASTGGGYLKCSDFTNIFPPGQNFTIVDTNAFHAAPSSTLEIQMMIQLPPGLHRILFLPTVSGTYNVGGVIIPAS